MGLVIEDGKGNSYQKGQIIDDEHGGRVMIMDLIPPPGKSPNEPGTWHYNRVRDFTRPLSLDAPAHPSVVSGVDRADAWKRNYEANKPHIKLSAGHVPQSDVVFLMASGPSLRTTLDEGWFTRDWGRYREWWEGVTVVGVNQVPADAFFFGYEGQALDYYFLTDYSAGAAKLPESMQNTTAIFDVAVTPTVHDCQFKEKRWTVTAFKSEFYDQTRADFPHLLPIEHGLNVTYCALSWIYQALGPKLIVLVGMDCAFTGGMKHFNEPLAFNPEDEYMVVGDIYGRPTITNWVYADIARFHGVAFYFLRDAGVRVINATEGGILNRFVEIMSMPEAIAEAKKVVAGKEE